MPCHPLSITTLFLSLNAAATGAPPLLDAPWRAFDTGDYPTFAPVAICMGDLDADGNPDLVTALEFFGGPGIAVLRGHGDGTYADEEVYALAHSKDLGDVALADIDLDGDLDVIASVPGNAGTDYRIVVWRNDGSGALGTAEFHLAGFGPVGIAVADFTGDGFPDVLTADNGYVAGTNDTISLMVHNGQEGPAASFHDPVSFTVGDNCTRLAIGDLDDDGDLDVAVGRGDFVGLGGHALSILFNDGAGGFGAPTNYEQFPGGYRHSPAVTLADIDRDGDLDLLGGGATNGTPSFGGFSVRLNDGFGTFGAAAIHQTEAWTFTPHTIATMDLDADGWLDVVVSTPSGRANDGFNVRLNDGKGGFRPVRRYDAGKQTYDLLGADVDDDGDTDVISVANDSSVVTVHRNQGDGTFPEPTLNELGFLTRDLVHGDIDRDGDQDLVAGGDEDIWLLHNQGDATFPPAQHVDTPFSPGDILLADMNNDGWLDIVIRAYDFAVALNDQEGGFEPAVVTFVGATQAGEVGAFDLDNDGDLDIVCTDPGPASAVYLFRNQGDGVSFTYANTIADFDGLPFGIAGGDLDHDGNVDLIFQNALGITVYGGRGDFTVGGPIPTADYGYPFVLHDMDGDGNLDLAYKRTEPSFGTVEVATMRGYGDLGFAFPKVEPGPTGRESAFRITSDVDVADIDGDAVPDVVFTNNAPNDVSVFRGAGDGAVRAHDRYGAGYSASDSALADFDGDELVDVAVVVSQAPSGLYDGVVILRNASAGPGVPGDVTGDGAVDVDDLLAVLTAWGACAGCPEDLDDDGIVGVSDLLLVLASWS